jgi:exoribonuclease R
VPRIARAYAAPVQRRLLLARVDDPRLLASFDQLRTSLGVEHDFPDDAKAEARRAAESFDAPEVDETRIPFVTIDPPESRDLDQALHLERRGSGYLVRYAIADVAALVSPGGPMDREAHDRGQTFYAADRNATLYPPELAENAASLLPGEARPTVLWTITLDESGEGTDVEVRRALVRSREKLDYAGVQRSLDEGTASESLQLLREVGRLREQREARIGGINLPLPEQIVEKTEDGYELRFRTPLPVEGWNAQISLLTGQAAAELMLDGRIGILRTLPRADERAVERLRRVATALGVAWPKGRSFADVMRDLDGAEPRHAAFLAESTVLLRGSGYAAFDGEPPPAASIHAGVGAPYTHATAPLRRLVDRYVSEICLAASAGHEAPAWVREALQALPETMEKSNRRAQQFEAGVLSAVEAAVLEPYLGDDFDAVVVELDEDDDRGTIQLARPAVTARCLGELPLGERIRARLVLADVEQRQVRFERV